MKSRSDWTSWLLLGGLTLLAGILRWAASPWHPRSPDAYYYLNLAKQALSGQWVLEFWGNGPMAPKPFYPLAVGVAHALGGGWEETGIYVSIVMGTLLVPLVFILGRTLFNPGTGWVAAGITAVSPTMIFYSTDVLSEATFMALFVAAVALGWRGMERGWLWGWSAVGVIAALAYLTRETGVVLLAIPLFAVFHALVSQKGWRNPLLGIGMVLILFLGLSAPYQIVSHRQLTEAQVSLLQTEGPEKPVPRIAGSDGVKDRETPPKEGGLTRIWSDWLAPRVGHVGERLVWTHFRNLDERERSTSQLNDSGTAFHSAGADPGEHRLTGSFLHDLGIVFRILWDNCRGFLWFLFMGQSLLVWGFCLVALGAGIFRSGEGVRGAAVFYPVVCVLGLVAFYSLAGMYTAAIGSERYMVPAKPLLWTLAGAGVVFSVRRLVAWWGAAPWKRAALYVGAAAVLFPSTIWLAPHEPLSWTWGKRPEPFVAERLGGWLRQHSGNESPKIFSRSPALPYYAGGRWVLLPSDPLDKIIVFAGRTGVSYLHYDVGMLRVRPQLRFLLDPAWKGDPRMERIAALPLEGHPEVYGTVFYRFKR